MIIKSTNKKLDGKSLFSLEFIKKIVNLPKIKNQKIKGKSDKLINGTSPRIYEETGTIKSFASDGEEVDGNIIYFLTKHTSSPYWNNEDDLMEDLGISPEIFEKALDPKNRRGFFEKYPESLFIKEIVTKKTYEKILKNSKTIKNGNIPELKERGLKEETIKESGVIDIRRLSKEDLDFSKKEKEEILEDILFNIYKEEKNILSKDYIKKEDLISLYKANVNILNKYKKILPEKSKEYETKIKEVLEKVKKQTNEKINIEELDNETDYFEDYFKQIKTTKDHPILFPYVNQIEKDNVSIVAGTTNREDNSKYTMINKNTFDITLMMAPPEKIFIVEGKMDELSLKQMLKEKGQYNGVQIITLSNVNTVKKKEFKELLLEKLKSPSLMELTLLLDNDNSGKEATENIIESIYDKDKNLLKKIKKGQEVVESLKGINDINDILTSKNNEKNNFLSLLRSEEIRIEIPKEEKVSLNKSVEYYKNKKEFLKTMTSYMYLKKDKREELNVKSIYIKDGKEIKKIQKKDIDNLLNLIKINNEYIKRTKNESVQEYKKRLEKKMEKQYEILLKEKKIEKVLFIESGKTLPHEVIYKKNIYGESIDKCFFINNPSSENPFKKIYDINVGQETKTKEGYYENIKRIIYEDVIKAHELDLNKPLQVQEITKRNNEETENFEKFKEWWLKKSNKRIEEISWKSKERKEKAKLEVEKELKLIEKTYSMFKEENKRDLLDYFMDLEDILKTYKENNIFYQIRGSAPSFTSFDLFGYTNLPNEDIERKLGDIKELMPPERFMSEYKFSMADVDIEVAGTDKERAVKLLNKKGFFLFLVKKELQNEEIQYAIHPCKMIEIPEELKKFVTKKTKYIHLDKSKLGNLVEKAFDIINQNISRKENVSLNEETIKSILNSDNQEGLTVEDVIKNDLPQITKAAKDMLLKYKGLEEEKINIKGMYGTLCLSVPKPSKALYGKTTKETLISLETGEEVTSNYKDVDIENQKGFYKSINSILNSKTEEIIKKYFPIEYNKNIDLLSTSTNIYEIMSAAASNRPAFTGEILKIDNVEYYFSIKDRVLISILDGKILKEENYPEEIKKELKDYFNYRYPKMKEEIEELEEEEEINNEEIEEEEKVFLPKAIEKRTVLDFIVENKKERKYFKNLNLTNGSILFQEQMTSFLVKIAEEYTNSQKIIGEEKENFIFEWKKKADVCQSFVKKTASSLTKETIENAISIFEDSKKLISLIDNEEFKREALDIFQLQFFAFENGAYLYNGAHGEMVAYNALQELLHKTKTNEIKQKLKKIKIQETKEEQELYIKRKEKQKKYYEEKQKEEEENSKKRYENSDEDFTLITKYTNKYVDNKTGKKYDSECNGIFINLEEIKELVKNKTLKKGFMKLTINKDEEIVDNNKTYDIKSIVKIDEKTKEEKKSVLIVTKNISKKEQNQINKYLFDKYAVNKYGNQNVELKENKIWLNYNEKYTNNQVEDIISIFNNFEIYSEEDIYQIEKDTNMLFNTKINPHKLSEEEIKKIKKIKEIKEEVKVNQVNKAKKQKEIFKISKGKDKNGYNKLYINVSILKEEEVKKVNEELKKQFGNVKNQNFPKYNIFYNKITINDTEEGKKDFDYILNYLNQNFNKENISKLKKEEEVNDNKNTIKKVSNVTFRVTPSKGRIYINFDKIEDEEKRKINVFLRKTYGVKENGYAKYNISQKNFIMLEDNEEGNNDCKNIVDYLNQNTQKEEISKVKKEEELNDNKNTIKEFSNVTFRVTPSKGKIYINFDKIEDEEKRKINVFLRKTYGVKENGYAKYNISQKNFIMLEDNEEGNNDCKNIVNYLNQNTQKEEELKTVEQNNNLLLENNKDFNLLIVSEGRGKTLIEGNKIKLHEEHGLTKDFLKWFKENKEIKLLVKENNVEVIFDKVIINNKDKKEIVFQMRGYKAGIKLTIRELVKIYQYSSLYKTNNQEDIKAKKIKIEDDSYYFETFEGDIKEVLFKTIPFTPIYNKEQNNGRTP